LQWLTFSRLGIFGKPRWACLIQNLLDQGGVAQGPNFGAGRQQGPAFVDPFDPGIFVVAVQGINSSNTIQISVDGGGSFCQLPVLTALVTESGRYALVGEYDPDLVFEAASGRFHGFPLSVPSHIAFNRRNPSQMLVASPYTGLYLGTVAKNPTGTPGCNESWQDLTPYLPSSRSYISASGFIQNAAFVSTEGRGAYEISNLAAAQAASFFDPVSSTSVGGEFATLHQGNGNPVPWGAVLVNARNVASPGVPITAEIRADGSGGLFLPNRVTPGLYILDLKFLGDGAITPSTVKFELIVN
jgi:hypothetical protein